MNYFCSNGSQMEWRFNKGRLPGNANFNPTIDFGTSTLTINNIIKKNEGNYSCFGIDWDNKTFVDDAELLVIGECYI